MMDKKPIMLTTLVVYPISVLLTSLRWHHKTLFLSEVPECCLVVE